MKSWKVILIIILFSTYSYSQGKYWITFKDKDTSNYKYKNCLSTSTLIRRNIQGLLLYQFTDVPVKIIYLKVIDSTVVKIKIVSN